MPRRVAGPMCQPRHPSCLQREPMIIDGNDDFEVETIKSDIQPIDETRSKTNEIIEVEVFSSIEEYTMWTLRQETGLSDEDQYSDTDYEDMVSPVAEDLGKLTQHHQASGLSKLMEEKLKKFYDTGMVDADLKNIYKADIVDKAPCKKLRNFFVEDIETSIKDIEMGDQVSARSTVDTPPMNNDRKKIDWRESDIVLEESSYKINWRESDIVLEESSCKRLKLEHTPLQMRLDAEIQKQD